MNKFTSMKYPVAVLSALAMSISLASANELKCECPCEDERSSVRAEQTYAQQGTAQATLASTRADAARSDARAEVESDTAARSTVPAASHAHYLSSKPSGNYLSGDLIGQKVTNRRDDKSIGTIDDLLFDSKGQISAVIIGVGGVLGMGKSDLAIAWDQIERKMVGDEVTLTVDVSDSSLTAAPKFARN